MTVVRKHGLNFYFDFFKNYYVLKSHIKHFKGVSSGIQIPRSWLKKNYVQQSEKGSLVSILNIVTLCTLLEILK